MRTFVRQGTTAQLWSRVNPKTAVAHGLGGGGGGGGGGGSRHRKASSLLGLTEALRAEWDWRRVEAFSEAERSVLSRAVVQLRDSAANDAPAPASISPTRGEREPGRLSRAVLMHRAASRRIGCGRRERRDGAVQRELDSRRLSDDYVELEFEAVAAGLAEEAVQAASSFDGRHVRFVNGTRARLVRLKHDAHWPGAAPAFNRGLDEVRRNRLWVERPPEPPPPPYERREPPPPPPAGKRVRRRWRLDASVWTPRPRTGNSGAYFETAEALRRTCAAMELETTPSPGCVALRRHCELSLGLPSRCRAPQAVPPQRRVGTPWRAPWRRRSCHRVCARAILRTCILSEPLCSCFSAPTTGLRPTGNDAAAAIHSIGWWSRRCLSRLSGVASSAPRLARCRVCRTSSAFCGSTRARSMVPSTTMLVHHASRVEPRASAACMAQMIALMSVAVFDLTMCSRSHLQGDHPRRAVRAPCAASRARTMRHRSMFNDAHLSLLTLLSLARARARCRWTLSRSCARPRVRAFAPLPCAFAFACLAPMGTVRSDIFNIQFNGFVMFTRDCSLTNRAAGYTEGHLETAFVTVDATESGPKLAGDEHNKRKALNRHEWLQVPLPSPRPPVGFGAQLSEAGLAAERGRVRLSFAATAGGGADCDAQVPANGAERHAARRYGGGTGEAAH